MHGVDDLIQMDQQSGLLQAASSWQNRRFLEFPMIKGVRSFRRSSFQFRVVVSTSFQLATNIDRMSAATASGSRGPAPSLLSGEYSFIKLAAVLLFAGAKGRFLL
jgi:hypothetical protein